MYKVCVHQCTLAVEYISVALSGMGVLSGGWFLHRIGISIILATLCFVREIQTIIQTSVCIRSVFPVQNKCWHVLYILRFEGFEEINFSKVAREDVRVKKSTAPPGFEPGTHGL